ncbi:vitamin K epoxide reductase family protein [Promicromonospora sp. NPDC060204]|uniref:vitamin K epoxide reductase family protein n=1 Tax=Promicromonospora sp. NPDC060204 TaxID=3347071 RepID=UPI003667C668
MTETGATTTSSDSSLDSSPDGGDEVATYGPKPLGGRAVALLLVVLGAVGFAASFALAVEKYLKLIDPNHTASCSINVFVDCGAAMSSWQGALLGFPNPYLGVAAFPVVITTGVVLLIGARLPRWYWISLLAGTVLGQALVFFLMYTSFHVIVALCPYCMVVWTIMWPLLWYQLVRGVQSGDLPASAGLRGVMVGNRHIILVIGYVAALAWLMIAVGGPLIDSF